MNWPSEEPTAPYKGSEGSHPLQLTSTASDLAPCTVFIVTVPTPIDRYKRPHCPALLRASETVGKVLKPGNVMGLAFKENCPDVRNIQRRSSGLSHCHSW